MRISSEFQNKNQPAARGVDFKLLLGGFFFLTAIAVMTVLTLMPLPGFIVKIMMVYTLVFMGMGLILAVAVDRIMEQRSNSSGGG